jgi:hypothetical protein
MVSSPPVSATRCLGVLVAATVGCALVVTWLLPVALEQSADAFDAALVRLCAGVALLAAGWLWLATLSTVLAALR